MIPSIWPNLLLGAAFIYAVYRYVLWIEPWTATPAEAARKRGDLVYDEDAERFIDHTGDDQ